MSPGPTFDRVYPALKEQLMSGRFAPGDHLEPAAIGQELNSSITPVRDALHRLVGERLVEAPRNDGFRIPAPTEAELRDLYAWNWGLLDIALRLQTPRSGRAALYSTHRTGALSDRPGCLTAADLFRRIARRSGNPEHEAAIERINDRLAAMRLAEAVLFTDLAGELEALRSLLGEEDLAGVRRAVAVYHRRRLRAAPDLLVAVRLPREPL